MTIESKVGGVAHCRAMLTVGMAAAIDAAHENAGVLLLADGYPGSTAWREAEDRLAAFLCRIPIRSERRPELDGAWFRAFDFGRWDYWASNADAGWGAWCVEMGWVQGWLVTTFALRKMRIKLWDLVTRRPLGDVFEKNLSLLLPDAAVTSSDRGSSQECAR
jgi:hypothetical protein